MVEITLKILNPRFLFLVGLALLVNSPFALSDTDDPVLNAISINQTSFDVSDGAQEIIYTVDASDESGIDWSAGANNTSVVLKDSSGNYAYALGDNDNPGLLKKTIDSSNKDGTWQISFLALEDKAGNRKIFSPSTLTNLGLPSSFEVVGGTEAVPPSLNSISVNKVTLDVKEGPQTVTYSVDASDESGINWGAGTNKTNVILYKSGYRWITGSNDDPGKLSTTFDSSDIGSGRWPIQAIEITDNVGNKLRYSSASTFANYGLPAFIYILADGESTSNITLSKDASIASVAENSEVSYNLTIENLDDNPTGQLSFELRSSNIRVSAVSQSGSSSCSISSSNYNSAVTCALSGVDANSSKSLNLTMTPGPAGTGTFHANIVADIADVSYVNNYVTVPLTIDPDGDGDGISDNSDNCPSTSNSDQLDTDSDGNGNVCDDDDDGDGVEDSSDAFPLDASETSDTDSDGVGDNSDNCPSESNSDQLDTDSDGSGNACDTDDDGDGVEDSSDAFPLDPSESLDTDSDGIGNNADTDDDGDGVSDTDDAYPLISVNGLTDTDNDGIPNDCDAACLETGMTADSDDDGDGVPDSEDAFPLDGSETTDTDGDGVGDNSDAFPNNHEYTKDTDSDGMPDAWETQFGLDPNDPSDKSGDADNDGVSNLQEFINGTVPSGSLDIDGNERYDALTDGLLILRSMFGLDGTSLTAGTAASDAVYSDSGDLITRINTLGDLADIDGSGEIDALTDGLLILRYLFGLEGETLVNGVVSSNATRTTQEIEDHLNMLMPVQ